MTVSRQLSLLTAIEIPFRRDVYREKNRYIGVASESWQRTQSFPDVEFEAHQSNMQEIFNKYYKRAMVFFSSDVQKQLDAVSKKTSLWEMLFRGYMTTKGGSRAKEVAGTTKDDLRRVIASAAESEEPEAVVVRRMLAVRGLSAFRADMIARTETHNAAMYASLETARDISADVQFEMMKIWNTTEDERTRDEHRDVDGQRQTLDGYFQVGGESLEKPSDGSAANSINCRCVLTYERA